MRMFYWALAAPRPDPEADSLLARGSSHCAFPFPVYLRQLLLQRGIGLSQKDSICHSSLFCAMASDDASVNVQQQSVDVPLIDIQHTEDVAIQSVTADLAEHVPL